LAPFVIHAAQNLLDPISKSNGPMAPRVLNQVLDKLDKDPESTFPTSMHRDVGRFLYALVRATRPRVIAETGTYIGYSTICMAQALEENVQGMIHCFDLFGAVMPPGDPYFYQSPVVGSKETFLDVVRGHFDTAG